MEFIDSHTHLYLEDFDGDRDTLAAKAAEKGISRFILPHIDSESTDRLHQLCASDPQKYFPMMGLHPCSVKENWKYELKLVEDHLQKNKYVAVGEIGLDLFWDKTFIEQQKDSFVKQIHWASDLNLPIVIHSRESIDILISILKKEAIKNLTGVFHCFTGTLDQAKEIIDLGFYLGIGGVLTFKNSGLDKTVSELPLESLILETDAPYLAPAPFRGKRNIPEYLLHIAERLAEVKEVSIEKIAEQTTTNSCRLFKLPEYEIQFKQ